MLGQGDISIFMRWSGAPPTLLIEDIAARAVTMQDAEAVVRLTGQKVLIITDRAPLCGASFCGKADFHSGVESVGLSYEQVVSLTGNPTIFLETVANVPHMYKWGPDTPRWHPPEQAVANNDQSFTEYDLASDEGNSFALHHVDNTGGDAEKYRRTYEIVRTYLDRHTISHSWRKAGASVLCVTNRPLTEIIAYGGWKPGPHVHQTISRYVDTQYVVTTGTRQLFEQ